MKKIENKFYVISYSIFKDGKEFLRGKEEIRDLQEIIEWMRYEKEHGNSFEIKDIYDVKEIRYKKNIFEKAKDSLVMKLRRA